MTSREPKTDGSVKKNRNPFSNNGGKIENNICDGVTKRTNFNVSRKLSTSKKSLSPFRLLSMLNSLECVQKSV